MSSESVVVTGIGLVTPLGLSNTEHLERARTMESAIGPLTAFDIPAESCPSAAQVPDFDVSEGMRFPKSIKFMNRPVQCGVRAALNAFRDSGLEPGQVDPERIGVYIGSGNTCLEPNYFMGPLGFAWSEGRERDYKHLGGRAARMIDRYFSLRTLSNAGIGLLSNEFNAKGPSVNFVHSETASLMAIQSAFYDVAEGRCAVAVAGGYDSLVQPTVYLDYQTRQLLSMAEPGCAYRPFDRHRDGISLGDGAAFFILERRDHAEKRNAPILGVISAIECLMAPQQEVAARLLAGVKPDFAVLRGFGTQDDDRCEYLGMQNLLDGAPVTAFKSRTGYLGAASAAVELGFGLLTAREGFVPAIARLETPDDACSLDLVANEPCPLNGEATGLFLSASLAGQNGGILARAVKG